MKFLDKIGLTTFINLIKSKKLFGSKIKLDNSVEERRKYLLEIDYDTELKFNTSALVSITNSPYVGSAQVGQTYVA